MRGGGRTDDGFQMRISIWICGTTHTTIEHITMKGLMEDLM